MSWLCRQGQFCLKYGAQLEIYGLIFWHLLLAASLQTQWSNAKCILAWYLYLLYLYSKIFLSSKTKFAVFYHDHFHTFKMLWLVCDQLIVPFKINLTNFWRLWDLYFYLIENICSSTLIKNISFHWLAVGVEKCFSICLKIFVSIEKNISYAWLAVDMEKYIYLRWERIFVSFEKEYLSQLRKNISYAWLALLT